jgi:predicted transcriptional regulator/transcriptional regulator with XRE-family HTH domain
MRKTFLGVKLKTLREQRGLTQAALAQLLDLSPSYLNQLENNQRPLSVPVLLRLQSSLGVDLQLFSDDDEARLTAQLQSVMAEAAGDTVVAQAELRSLAQQMPALAQVVIRMHRRGRDAQDRLSSLAATLGDRAGELAPSARQPHEEVRDFFYERHNHIAALDERAEALGEVVHAAPAAAARPGPPAHRDDGGRPPDPRDLAARLEAFLLRAHGVATRPLPHDGPQSEGGTLRRFDKENKVLYVGDAAEPGQRAFQLATQLATLDASALIDELADAGNFSSPESRSLARIGLASYFAGALVLPYRRFLGAAELLSYDIDLLAQRFGVSFETVCHRLSTLQRPQARGIPFFFVRVDRAGNISKRQSATDFHFSHTGGTCPLWNVYEAFAQPAKVLTQVARMPDGRTYLWIARCVSRATGGYGSPERTFAIGLGCDVRHASRLVYAKGLDLADAELATPIGAGCRICDRKACPQRAFPALGKRLQIDENERPRAPYASR